jgi:hypothetical protein
MEKVFLKEDNNKALIPNAQTPALFGGHVADSKKLPPERDHWFEKIFY